MIDADGVSHDVLEYIWEQAESDGATLRDVIAALIEYGTPGMATVEEAGKLAAHLVRTELLIPAELDGDDFAPWSSSPGHSAERIERETLRIAREKRLPLPGEVVWLVAPRISERQPEV
ncbi:hypothetical protein [Actinoalloteichus caeruleus]|uniref:hypothetical protein n=1 Tax=Actinoalloteichus cyanogriseus TaxID=2893586 RepID=UPI003AAE8C1F